MNDPAWLLATMAQSAAALVAIAGGFLVSRIVTMSSERQGLEQRGRELEQRIRSQRKLLEETTERRRQSTWTWFKDYAADRCAERWVEHGSLSPEWIVREFPLAGATSEEVLKMAEFTVRQIQQANEYFETGEGLPVPPGTGRDPDIYGAVNNVRSPGSSPLKDSVVAFKIRWQRYDELINEERARRERLDLLKDKRDFVRTETNTRVAEPRTLRPVVITFAYLTLVGVVVPVIGLLWRPVWSDLLIRIGLVALFVAGLVALGWYLILAIRRLSKSSVPQDQDEQTQVEGGEPPGA